MKVIQGSCTSLIKSAFNLKVGRQRLSFLQSEDKLWSWAKVASCARIILVIVHFLKKKKQVNESDWSFELDKIARPADGPYSRGL